MKYIILIILLFTVPVMAFEVGDYVEMTPRAVRVLDDYFRGTVTKIKPMMQDGENLPVYDLITIVAGGCSEEMPRGHLQEVKGVMYEGIMGVYYPNDFPSKECSKKQEEDKCEECCKKCCE